MTDVFDANVELIKKLMYPKIMEIIIKLEDKYEVNILDQAIMSTQSTRHNDVVYNMDFSDYTSQTPKSIEFDLTLYTKQYNDKISDILKDLHGPLEKLFNCKIPLMYGTTLKGRNFSSFIIPITIKGE